MSSHVPPERRDEGPGGYRMPFGGHKDSYVEWHLGLEGLRDPLRGNLHALVRGLYELAGGADADAPALFAPEPGADAKPPARLAK